MIKKASSIQRRALWALLFVAMLTGFAWANNARTLYVNNCQTCHGLDGQSSTAVGRSLNARNLLTDTFKQGDSVEAIAKTLETGVPGTGMASFAYLNEGDRLTLAKYVAELRAKSTPASSSEKVDSISTPQEASKVTSSTANTESPVETPAENITQEPQPAAPLQDQVESPAVPIEKASQEETPSTPSMAIDAETNSEASKDNLIEKSVATVKSILNPTPTPAPENTASAPTPQMEDPLITKGRQLYKKNGCASCHGEKGQADTPTGKALNARSFVIGDYKMGGDLAGISKAINEGVPGTAMAAYANINEEDRMALATFIMGLKGNPDLAVDPAPTVQAGSGHVSITYAMDLLAEETRYPHKVNFMDASAGSKLFTQHCAQCHGDNGQGGVGVRMISSAPFYRVQTLPLLGHDGPWMSEEQFKDIVTNGLSGRMMPGLGTLTRQQFKDLYQFFIDSRDKVKK